MGNSVPHCTFSKYNDGYWYSAKFEETPFASGAFRNVFRGILESDSPANGRRIVTKVFKKSEEKYFKSWEPDLVASKKAYKYAVKFNEVLETKMLLTKRRDITFNVPLILQVSDVPHFSLFGMFKIFEEDTYTQPGKYVAVEDYIPGRYMKFNSNAGYEDSEASTLLPAFCHWTWHVSKYNFMICDLQGVKTDNEYILTDPVVHSREELYGCTDMGVAGMTRVLQGHTCNKLCRSLGLENPLKFTFRNPIANPSTTYRFQLTDEEKLRNKRRRSLYFEPGYD